MRGPVCQLVLAAAVCACTLSNARADKAARPPVTLVVTGEPQLVGAVREGAQQSKSLPVELGVRDLPNAPPRDELATADLESRLADARRSYIDARFAACTDGLGDDVDLEALLAVGRRDLAARVLFWRTACQVGLGRTAAAEREAEALAVFGLRLPPDVEAATPEVEAVLASARKAVERTPRVELTVRAADTVADVAIDGAERACVTPCALRVPPGLHYVALRADGFAPQVRPVTVTGQSPPLEVTLSPATPEVAARQWTRRYANTPLVDSAPSMQLLAAATRSRRIVLLSADRAGQGNRLRAVLAVDGEVRARGERRKVRDDEVAEQTDALVRDLLVQGRVIGASVPLYRRPAFWLAVGAAATVAAGVTAYFLFDPERRTEVTF